MTNEAERERIEVSKRLSHITGFPSSLMSERKLLNFVLAEKYASKQEIVSKILERLLARATFVEKPIKDIKDAKGVNSI